MNLDSEMNQWRAGWQANASEPQTASSTEDMIRQRARQKRRVFAEMVAGTLFLVGSATLAWFNPSVESVLWAAIVWITTLLAATFTLWNWWWLWEASSMSVSDFEALSRRRATARIRAATFGFAFLVLQVGISAVWFSADLMLHRISGPRFATGMAILVPITIAYGVHFGRTRKTAVNELAAIRHFEKDEEST